MKKTLIYGNCIKIPIKKNVPWRKKAARSFYPADSFLISFKNFLNFL